MTDTLPSPGRPLKIGTRGSPLALAQAHETRTRLSTVHNLPETAFEIVVIRTSGDRIQDRPLKDIGGKGLFTKEIEDAMLDGSIDIAVHSTKDMPVAQPKGLILDVFLPREDPRDAFLAAEGLTLSSLPEGTVVGTSSLRRKAQLLNRFPHLKVVEFRGNVQTRLEKLSNGVAQGTFLAMAGLNRLDLDLPQASPVPTDDMLPAVAQGIIGIECRADDLRTRALLDPINDPETALRATAERSFLRVLDGSCETPIAALSHVEADEIVMQGEVLRPDGTDKIAVEGRARKDQAEALGRSLGQQILDQAPEGFFDWRASAPKNG